MTAALITRPSPTATEHALRSIHRVLDGVDGADILGGAGGVRAVGGAQARAVVEQVDRAVARLRALRLAAVAAAHRAGAAEQQGAAGTPAWLASISRSDGATAARDVHLATALDGGLSRTRTALGEGSVSVEHAQVIASALAQAPSSLEPEQRDRLEGGLLAQAAVLDPGRLRKVARRSLSLLPEVPAHQVDAHEDGVVQSEADAALAKARLTWHDNRDGSTSGHFTVPTFAASVLVKAVQQIASPRRFAARAASDARTRAHGTGKRLSADTRSEVWEAFRAADGDWAHRYGTAFVELLEHLPTDRLAGKVAATVVVTIGHEALLGGSVDEVARTDTGDVLSAGDARRLACGAGILPVVLGGASLPLDLGRQQRFFTEHQRVALASVYDECAAEGCDRPYAWTELHHQDPWHAGGATDLSLAVPLCGHHHRLVHHRGHAHVIETDPRGVKSARFRRRS